MNSREPGLGVVSCDVCKAMVTINGDELPAGWRSTDSVDVCPNCSAAAIKPTGRAGELSLEGMFMALDEEGDPIMVRLDGEQGILFVPVFTTVSKLRASLTDAGAVWQREVELSDHEGVIAWFRGLAIAAVDDGQDVRLVVDIHRTAEGVTRFSQIVIPPEVES